MDISNLEARPGQQQHIATHLVAYAEREKPFAALKQCLRQNGQCYVICPLVEASAKLNTWDAVSTYHNFKRILPGINIGLLHGQMDSAAQQSALNDFRTGKTRVLVSTTVVEVGVDVPEAVMMIVLSGERFGLSQLHQLRGRIGRGAQASQCWLISGPQAGEEALRRLQILCETGDGLRIAEADLGMRGPGETFGYRQSGLPPFRIANWIKDARFIPSLREAVSQLTPATPQYVSLRQETLRRYGKYMGLLDSG
jgi:ATP-dependent DNA helicase RecG